MSAPSPPPDNSMAIEASRQAAADKLRNEQKAEAEAKSANLLNLRNSAGTAARGAAENYFRGHGADPGQYGSDIDSLFQTTMAGISPDDPNPGAAFTGFGENAFNTAQNNFRSGNSRAIDKLFAPNFETQRIPFTLDDPYLSSIEAEGRASADDIIQNMLARHVITSSGANAARADLDRQSSGVRSRLNEVGTTTLSEGQGGLRNIANKGRQTANTIDLGSAFDAQSYGNEADTYFNDFISKLGDTIRGKAPANLFNTAGLGTIAGAAQGVQNLPFDPGALNGEAADDDETKKKDEVNNESIF